MADLLIVVDQHKDWKSYYATDNVITFQDYLTQASGPIPRGTHVINLCRQYRYLSNGYYCSLLAEARGHRVLPSVCTLNDLGRKAIYGPRVSELAAALKSMDTRDALRTPGQAEVLMYFGTTPHAALASLARQLFEQFPSPILRVTFRSVSAAGGGEEWVIQSVQAVALNQLDGEDEDRFAEALDQFSRRVWRKPRSRKAARFDLAILVNPDEAMPPSDSTALKQFVKAGKALGIDVDMIHKADLSRLSEFDGLFIRETTGIDNHTYRFARKAEALGLMVIDDPDSILKCTNKVYLADLLARNRVPTPATRIISKDQSSDLTALADAMAFPLVLKIPDGRFSRDVVATAVKAASLIGQGLYGVDLKQCGQQAVVIEVNDNPSIDSGVEDQFLGRDQYRIIMEDFLHRMEARGQ